MSLEDKYIKDIINIFQKLEDEINADKYSTTEERRNIKTIIKILNGKGDVAKIARTLDNYYWNTGFGIFNRYYINVGDLGYKLDYLMDTERPKSIYREAPLSPFPFPKYLERKVERKVEKKGNKDWWEEEFEEYRPRRQEKLKKIKSYSGKKRGARSRKCYHRKGYTRKDGIKVKSTKVCRR